MYRPSDTASNQEVVKAGYLTKSPPGDAPPMSQWRRRWFVLCDSLRAYPLAERHVRLEYFQNEAEARKLCDPKGVIELKNCSRVSGVARLKGHNYVFDIFTKDRTYHIAAETPTEKYEWMKTLNELLFTHPNVSNGIKEVQDLEHAEVLRNKIVAKATAERQNSLGELSNKSSRPVSCFIRPGAAEMKSIDEFKDNNTCVRLQQQQQGEYRKRPLPPTPDGLNTSLTLVPPTQSSPKPSPSPTPQSPPPPVPKPRSKNSVEKQNVFSPPTVSPYMPNFTQRPITTDIKGLSSSYENISALKPGPDYEDITDDLPPRPPPRTGVKTSLEDMTIPLSLSPARPSHDSQPVTMTTNSGYENISTRNTNILVPDYEEVEGGDMGGDSPQGDRIVFLDQDVYADPSINPDNFLYNQSMEATTYEVPVRLAASPPPPMPPQRGSNIRSAPQLPNSRGVPPKPPPRDRGRRRQGSLHRSLVDLADDGLYSELQNDEVMSDEEHYGRLIRIVGGGNRERRFSDPEIIPISPRSHSSSPLSFNITKSTGISPPPVPPPYSGISRTPQQQRYYENAGLVRHVPNNADSSRSSKHL